MQKFKQAICIITVFVLSTLFVAGCALFELDVEYHNNLVVAQVGNDITIRKIDLINGFNSFGGQFMQQGMSREEAVDATLELLIDREIMVELSIRNFSNLTNAQISAWRGDRGLSSLYYRALTEQEQSEVRRMAFDAMDNNFRTIENRVRTERNMNTIATGGDDQRPAPLFEPFDPFVPFINVSGNNDVFTIDVSHFAEREPVFAPSSWTVPTRGDSVPEQGVTREATARMVRTLQVAERGLTFAEDRGVSQAVRDQNVINREIGRLVEIFSKNVLIRRHRDLFEQGLTSPITEAEIQAQMEFTASRQDAYRMAVEARWTEMGLDMEGIFRVNLMANQVEQVFLANVHAQVDAFRRGFVTEDSMRNQIIQIGNLENIFWIPEEIIDDFFTVSHILIRYTDEQNREIAAMRDLMRRGGANAQDMQNLIDGFVEGGLTVNQRDEEGHETGVIKTATQVLQDLNNAMLPLAEHNAEQRARVFRDFIYRYNMDPGMINTEFEYVMSVRETAMVPQFTDASRELFGFHQVPVIDHVTGQHAVDQVTGQPIFTWERNLNANPIRSAVSDLVVTENGVHIIMYTRNLRDFIFHSDQVTTNNWQPFLFAALNSYGTEFAAICADTGNLTTREVHARTRFDALMERMHGPSYEQHERSLIVTFRQHPSNQITINRGNFRDLFE